MTMQHSTKSTTTTSSGGLHQDHSRWKASFVGSHRNSYTADRHATPVLSPGASSNAPLFQTIEDDDYCSHKSSHHLDAAQLTASPSAVSSQSTNAASQSGCNHEPDGSYHGAVVATAAGGKAPTAAAAITSPESSGVAVTRRGGSPASGRFVQKRERHYSYLLQIQQLVNTSLSKDVSGVVKRAMQASEECDPEALSNELAQSNRVLNNVLAASMVTKTVAYYRGGRIVGRNVPSSFLLSMSSYSIRQLHSIFFRGRRKTQRAPKTIQKVQ
eukprot:gb/GECG01015182.1/.p1 GENE.gb/GECG01015182.1/~~gb/GECG01015182.1/.p1  ORF type:complete len:271 (+),score=27.43 gb/GECG01015182.1/:1-813(+)